jgi:hypothetical protein
LIGDELLARMNPKDLKALTSLLKAKQAGTFPGIPTSLTIEGPPEKLAQGLGQAPLLGYPNGRVVAEYLGRGLVRRTGDMAAICYVTEGFLRQNARVRVIRDGIVVHPPADRSANLDSLRQHDEDVSTIGEGRECCVKIAGYDDIKAGDLIEAFRLEGDEAA